MAFAAIVADIDAVGIGVEEITRLGG